MSESFKYYFKTEDIDSNCCKLYRIGIHLLGKTFKNLFKSRMKNRREIIILESSELSKYSFTTFFNDKLNRYRFFQFHIYTIRRKNSVHIFPRCSTSIIVVDNVSGRAELVGQATSIEAFQMPLEILRHVSFHELEWKRKKHGEKFR